MARISLPESDAMTLEQQQVVQAIGDLRGGHIPLPYRAALHSPELAYKWQQLGELLRYRTSLPKRLSELAILVVAQVYHCQHIWNAHSKVALAAGIPEDIVKSIEVGEKPAFAAADEEVVYKFSRELLETRHVSDRAHENAITALGVKGLVELTALLGYYVMVAMMLTSHELG